VSSILNQSNQSSISFLKSIHESENDFNIEVEEGYTDFG